jgi:hypothetical protein
MLDHQGGLTLMPKPKAAKKAAKRKPVIPVINPNVEHPIDHRRREVMFGLLSVALMAPPAIDAMENILGWRIDKRVSSLNEVTRPLSDEEKAARIRDIFFPREGFFDLVPAMNHPVFAHPPGRTYPNEEFAQNAILKLFPGAASELMDHPFEVDPSHSIVLLGSSIANRYTRHIFGDPLHPKFTFTGPGFHIDFQYSIRSLQNQFVTRLQDGNSDWRVTNNAVVDCNGNYVAVPESDAHSRLKTDLLLVTRIPRRLGGVDQIIFSPTHGTGLRAVDNLLFHLPQNDLEWLEKELDRESCFQAIFEVADLYEANGTTHPGSIRVMRKKGGSPVRLNVKST